MNPSRRILSIVFALAGSLFLLASCSTMEAAEKKRLERLEAKKKEAAAAKAEAASLPAGLSQETGALFQPLDKSLTYSKEAAKLEKSVDQASLSQQATAVGTTQVIAPGPDPVSFKAVLQTAKELELVAKGYEAFCAATYDVMVSLRAYGLAKNVKGIETVRAVSAEWQAYLASMKIAPRGNGITTERTRAFFHSLGKSQVLLDEAIAGINSYLDRQRTRSWQAISGPQQPATTTTTATPASLAPTATPSPASTPAP